MKEPKDPESANPNEPLAGAQHHPDGAFDDPLHDWWQKNGRSVVSGAILAIVATAVVFGFRGYRKAQVDQLQAAYNEALAAEELDGFALDHAGHPLAGVAALRTANVAFGEDDWNRALEYYIVAVDSLANNPLHGKARLGLAVTRTKLGEDAEAIRVLEALANDEEAFPAARAEAMYFLALKALSAGDRQAFEQWSDSLAEVDRMAVWQNRLRYYRESVPIPVVEAPAAETEGPEEQAMESEEETAESEGEAAGETLGDTEIPVEPQAPDGDAD